MSTEPWRCLYAPNVHTGGGVVLLIALLKSWPQKQPLQAWLDVRAQSLLPLPLGAQITWVRPTLLSRMMAEWQLSRSAMPGGLVLAFHGLPPLLPNRSRVEVFLQNRLLLGADSLAAFAWRVRVRLQMEQSISRWRRTAVDRYWVQTPSMANAVRAWWSGGALPEVSVSPFVPALPSVSRARNQRWDFVFVADGAAHKNHRTLIQAWILLAQDGIRPSLALTLSARDGELARWIDAMSKAHGLSISNLGTLDHAQVLSLYAETGALIFPSLTESFGLPLLEARTLGLPILAAELDYVRDVCEPAQTFDAGSAVSIARAVRRFLRQDEAIADPVLAADFLRAVLGVSA